MKKSVALIFLMVLAASFLTGCKKEDKGDPPGLPPVQSMAIDFSNFELEGKSSIPGQSAKGTEDSNWRFASTVAMLWKGVIVTTLAVPATAFQIAINKTPGYLSDKTWQWSYDATVTIDQVSATYKVRLTGQIKTSDVLWKMYIAKEGTGGFAEFLWVTGTSKVDGTGGQWKVNQSSQYQQPVLQIDWTKSGTSVGMVKYTWIKTGDSFKDSYIEYGLTSGDLNAYYIIHYYNDQQFSDLNVEWSTIGKNGRVKCPVYFGDTSWYCWDGNHINITCP